MTLRTTRVPTVVGSHSSTSEHPDKRRQNRTIVASEYNKKINGSSADVPQQKSFRDILEISAEGMTYARKSNWQGE